MRCVWWDVDPDGFQLLENSTTRISPGMATGCQRQATEANEYGETQG